MPAENHVGLSSAWRRAIDQFIGVSSAWRQWKEAYIGVGGTWRLSYKRLFTITISSNTTYFKVRDAVIAAGWDTVVPIDLILEINLSIYVIPSSTATWAIDFQQAFPAGSTVKVVCRGILAAKGGVGGNGAGDLSGATAGAAGGDCMKIYENITIDLVPTLSGGNIISGFILGGGGGGGGGGLVTA